MIKGCLGVKIFGVWVEFVRFRIWISKNIIIIVKVKIIRFVIIKVFCDVEMF